MAELCTATIRAVAQGVVGIAFIQMLLIGVAFLIKGIPGAGLLALAILLLGIMQLPATLITVPVIAVVFATEGATVASIAFAIYTFVAGLADNVLKPLLLGRGLDVPMPVVLIGAIGGMVSRRHHRAFHRSGSTGGGLPAVLAMGRPTTPVRRKRRATPHLMCRGARRIEGARSCERRPSVA